MLRKIQQKCSRALTALDSGLVQFALAGVGWLKWPFLFAIGLGAGVWTFTHPADLALLDTNKLPNPVRLRQVFWVVGALGALLFLYVGAALIYRKKLGSIGIQGSIARINRYLYPLLSLPLIGILTLPGIEKSSGKLTLLFCALIGTAFGRTFYELPQPRFAEDAPESEGKKPSWLPKIAVALVLVALFVGYGLFFSRLAITNHHALNTRTTDLGYYDNIFYQSIHGRPLGCSFVKTGYHNSAHFDPILILLSPLYLIYPHTELLLCLQSFWLGSGVFPVYLIAKEKLNHRLAGIIFAIIYATYPAVHGANMYEFHSLTLISPLMIWLIYFFERSMWKSYFGMMAALLLCREDVPLLLCFVGAYALLSQKPKAALVGRWTIGISIVYFIIAKTVFMPSASLMGAGKESYSYAYYYEELIPDKTGAGQLLVSLVTNPAFALKVMTEETKFIWFALIFAPLGFLPFAARRARFMLVYGLLFILLASRDPVYSIHFQYPAIIFPIAFAITPIALQRIRDGGMSIFGLDGRRFYTAIVAATFVTALMISWKFGGLTNNQSFRGGFGPVTRVLNAEQKARYGWVREMTERIPKGASVSATPKLGPHISNRRHAYFYPSQPTDFVFADETELKPPQVEQLQKAVQTGDLVEVGRNGKMGLWKRRGL